MPTAHVGAPPARVLVCVMAAAVFAVVMFNVLNADGYLAEWYLAVTCEKWAWAGRCLLLPCSRW